MAATDSEVPAFDSLGIGCMPGSSALVYLQAGVEQVPPEQVLPEEHLVTADHSVQPSPLESPHVLYPVVPSHCFAPDVHAFVHVFLH